jgi:hypothetical protein
MQCRFYVERKAVKKTPLVMQFCFDMGWFLHIVLGRDSIRL